MSDPKYAVAVIGGATAGAEAARIFCNAGIITAVFEQNDRPYGKVEDGLPRWHSNLRKKEYGKIDEKIDHPLVRFVPRTRLGETLNFQELTDVWGFNAVVLANGAWRDRPLPIEGIAPFIDHGLLYQNAVIYWFNHEHEIDYSGLRYEIPDGTIIVGGGLASLDVAKVCQFFITRQALSARGIHVDVLELEERGIPAVLESHGLAWEDLKLRGTTVYYRRRIEDMPLSELPKSPNEAQIEKAGRVRRKIAEKAMQRYLFRIEELHAPTGSLTGPTTDSTDEKRLTGLRFARTKIEDGRVQQTDETVDVSAELTISSIGAVPAPIEGIPMRGELYDYSDWDLGTFASIPRVYGVGNVVTGKGNLVASRRHAKFVASHLTDRIESILTVIENLPPLGTEELATIEERIRAAQEKVGYHGRYLDWIKEHTPVEP